MRSPFAEMLAGLTRQRGVLGSMVVGESDGLIVDASLQVGVKGPVVAALAASLYRKARLSASAAGMGAVSFMQLEAPGGRICAVGGGELVLVVVAEAAVNVGLVRVELLKAIADLTDLGGGRR